jgi:hypothetical protein
MTDTSPPHGDDYDAPLHALLDGELDARALTALEQHLAACAVCRATLADLRTLHQAARSLERHVPPVRLWSQVVSGIDRVRPTVAIPAPGRHRAWQSLATAAVLVGMASSLWWVGARLSDPALPGEQVARTDEAADLDGGVDEELRLVEARYGDAIDSLEAILSLSTGGRAGVDGTPGDVTPPRGLDAVTVLQTSIADVDDAIGESRSALADEPSNEAARSSLIDALGQKVALLHDTVNLLDDVRAETGAEREPTP